MLKYYSYYNVGGYKDMCLGNSAMKEDHTYFMPLLPMWEKKAAAGDPDLAKKVNDLKKLAEISIVSNENLQGLPPDARKLFSHGGYKVMLTNEADGSAILAVRDIESGKDDDSGRDTPFLIVVTATPDDADALRRAAVYAASHLETFSQTVASLFGYDPEKNGLSFHLSEANEYFGKISQESDCRLLTIDGEVVIGSADAALCVVPEGLDEALAQKEQGLAGKRVKYVRLTDILPLDNLKRLTAILNGMDRRKQNVFADRRVAYALGGAAIFGFLVGYFLTR